MVTELGLYLSKLGSIPRLPTGGIMRVIKDGVEIERACLNCKSILAIAPEDVEDNIGNNPFAICPICGKGIALRMSEMPPLFRQRVEWDE